MNAPSATDRTFAAIPTRRGEELRLGFSAFKGRTYIAFWIWYADNHDEMKPSNKGINFKIELLPNIADGIHKALEAARANGLLG
jgi:transcriptional coactivator p15 (PC4)